MPSEDLQKFLHHPQKQVGAARGVLSRLFRLILADLRINHMLWNKLMRRYLDDPRNGIPNNSKDRSSHRGNLSKELRRAKMTWNVFEKGIRFLGPKWFRITIDMGWESGRVTTHTILVPNQRQGVTLPVEGGEEEDYNPVDPGFREGIPSHQEADPLKT